MACCQPRRVPLLAVTVIMTAAAAAAHAHGRVPAMLSVNTLPDTPDVLVAGTTFGTLLSTDAGRRWRWICEEAYASKGRTDPIFARTRHGTLFIITDVSLGVSRDGGCDWTLVPGFETGFPSDLQLTSGDAGDVLYVSTGRGDLVNAVSRSRDDGVTFVPILQREKVLFSSVRAPQHAAGLLYVTGWWYEPPQSWLFRSEDGGATWDTFPQDAFPGPFRLLAVAASASNVLFAVSESPVSDALLRSDDGGKTFAKVFASREPVRNLVLSADGQNAWLATQSSVLRSQDGGRTFSPLRQPQQDACVATSGNALFACGSRYTDGWEIATSRDAGDTWNRLLRFDEIEGPLACPGGTSAAICAGLWPIVATQVGIDSTPPGAGNAGVPPTNVPPATRSGSCAYLGGARPAPVIDLLLLATALSLAGRYRGRSKR